MKVYVKTSSVENYILFPANRPTKIFPDSVGTLCDSLTIKCRATLRRASCSPAEYCAAWPPWWKGLAAVWWQWRVAQDSWSSSCWQSEWTSPTTCDAQGTLFLMRPPPDTTFRPQQQETWRQTLKWNLIGFPRIFKNHFPYFFNTFSIRARPISFFWADTDVFQFSLPISDADIFVLLKQYLFCLIRRNNDSWSYFAFSQTFSNYSWKTLQCIFFFRPHKQRE